MKFNQIYNNFSSGELAPVLKGRTDIEEYYKGADEITNFIPLKQGGVYFRPGTAISGELPSSYTTKAFAQHPFSPKDGENYLVFLRPDNGSDQIVIIELDTGTVCTITRSSYIWNRRVDFTDSTNAYVWNADFADFTDICDKLVFVQKGDVFIIFDGTGKLAPIVGLRTGLTTFTVDSMIKPSLVNSNTNLTAIDPLFKLALRTPYKDRNITADLKLKPSATTGSITISAENASAAAVNFFNGDPVGMLIRIEHAATEGVAYVTAKLSDSQVSATVLTAFGATTASTFFSVSAWNNKEGYPTAACFFEGRLDVGGTPKAPDTIYASLIGNIYHFAQRRLVQDSSSDVSGLNFFGSTKISDPFSFTVDSEKTSSIQWMYPSDTLLIGTTGAEYSISGGSDQVLSLDSIFIRSISSHGSAKVKPAKVGSSLLFVSYDGKRLLEIPKKLSDYVSATDLSSISDGISDKQSEAVLGGSASYLLSRVVQIVYQESESILWLRCKGSSVSNTFILSLTMDRTTKSLGWAKHRFPKILPASSSGEAPVFSMAVAPDSLRNNYSTLFLYTQRNTSIGGYVFERLWNRHKYTSMGSGTTFASDSGHRTAIYLDACSIYDLSDFTGDVLTLNTEQSSFAQNTYLLAVVADGSYLGDFAIANSNEITIPNSSSYAHFIVGIRYVGEVKTLPMEAGAQFGSAQGSARRPHEMSVYVLNSRGGKYKQSKAANFYPLIKDTLSDADELYSGEVKLAMNASPDDHQTLVSQTVPYPLNILWLLTKGYTYDA